MYVFFVCYAGVSCKEKKKDVLVKTKVQLH